MANQDFNVLGNQRGKVGNVVGFVRKGKQCYRGYVAHVSQSKSEALAIWKARFATLGKLGMAFRGAVNRGYQRLLKGSGMTAVNIFVKKNKEAVTLASLGSDPTVDYGALVVAEGNLPFVSFGAIDTSEESTVEVPFDTDSATYPGATENDQVYLFVYQPDTLTGIMSLPASRSAGAVTLEVPKVWSGMKVHVYGFAVNPEEHWDENLLATIPQGEASNSTYIGQATIA